VKTFRLTIRSIAALLVSACAGLCQNPFPTTAAENLLGARVTLPDLAKGHAAVLVIGFTHASQAETSAWAAKLAPQMETFSIAVLEDVPKLVRPMATGGIRSGVPKNQRDHFLLVFRGEKELKEAAGFDRPDDAYLLLVDKDGVIRWRFHGPPADSVIAELKAAGN
jgi:hypothetical protein